MSARRRGFLRSNSLSLVFLAIFLAALAGQAMAGQRLYNEEQRAHGEQTASLGEFLTSSRFAVETTENWQSEFLQFTLYIFGTVWLIQRGSSESKKPGEEGGDSDEDAMLGPDGRITAIEKFGLRSVSVQRVGHREGERRNPRVRRASVLRNCAEYGQWRGSAADRADCDRYRNN
jgi:hypothetical protein